MNQYGNKNLHITNIYFNNTIKLCYNVIDCDRNNFNAITEFTL